MNPFLLIAMAAGIAGMVHAQASKKAPSGSGPNLSALIALNNAQATGSALSNLSGTTTAQLASQTALINSLGGSVNKALNAQSSNIAAIGKNSSAVLSSLSSDVATLSNKVANLQPTITINAPAPPGPSPGFLGSNTWF